MHSVTYIGTDLDQSESLTLDGVTYERGEAVHVEHVHPEIEGNPTFSVEKIEDEDEHPAVDEEKADEAPKPAHKTRTRKAAATK